MTRIFVAHYRNKNSQWTNLYAIDSEYGGDELNERNLERAIEKSGAYSYDSFALTDIEYDGEELIYEQLTDEIKQQKIRHHERLIADSEEELERAKKIEAEGGAIWMNRVEYVERQLKNDREMLERIKNDEW